MATAATIVSSRDEVTLIPESTVPSQSTTRAEAAELPASPTTVSTSKDAAGSTELPASPITSSLSETTEPTIVETMSTRKKDWISDENHNGPPLEDTKHDPRAGSGLEFVSPLEEEEKQLHQGQPENEESSPKYGISKPESEGLQAIPGQENKPIYINNDKDEEEERPPREESDWQFTLCSCWKEGGLCTSPHFLHGKNGVVS